MTRKVEALVIGAGPGGYVAAIRLGQLGKEVVLVDKAELGGVCLNVGCIPSKALIQAAKLRRRIEDAAEFGLEASGLRVDFVKLQSWKRSMVERLRSRIGHLCKANRVEVIRGEAKFLAPHTIEIMGSESAEQIEAKDIIIATGSRPVELSGFKFDGEFVISSTEALELTEPPKNLVVIGGGATGLEIGTMYAQFGSRVTVVEVLSQLLPGVDPDVVQVVSRKLRRLRVDAHVSAKAKGLKDGSVQVQLSDGGEIEVEADKVLVTVGRRPNSDGIALDRTGVETDSHGFIRVNEQLRTNVSGIYAIGDVIGPPMLAHKASKEGIVAAEAIAGLKSAADFRAIPNVIFTDPQIASAGLTEAQAHEKGYDLMVGRFPFAALGRALIARETEGFVKVVADAKTEQVLGVHMVGPDVSDLISEAALAIEMGASVEDIALTVHPHPTLPESVMEAAEAAKGKAIHILRSK